MLDIQAGFLLKGLFSVWRHVRWKLTMWMKRSQYGHINFSYLCSIIHKRILMVNLFKRLFSKLEMKHFSCIIFVIWVWLESKLLVSNIVKEKCSVHKDNGNKAYFSFSLWLFSCIFQPFIERVQLNCTIMSISVTFKCGSCVVLLFFLKYHCRLYKTPGAAFLLVLFCHSCHSNNNKSIKIHLIHFLIMYAVMNFQLSSVDSDVWRYLKSTLNTTIPFNNIQTRLKLSPISWWFL